MLKPGQTRLILGATGGVGTLAARIAAEPRENSARPRRSTAPTAGRRSGYEPCTQNAWMRALTPSATASRSLPTRDRRDEFRRAEREALDGDPRSAIALKR
jgi:hypothetical protein